MFNYNTFLNESKIKKCSKCNWKFEGDILTNRTKNSTISVLFKNRKLISKFVGKDNKGQSFMFDNHYEEPTWDGVKGIYAVVQDKYSKVSNDAKQAFKDLRYDDIYKIIPKTVRKTTDLEDTLNELNEESDYDKFQRLKRSNYKKEFRNLKGGTKVLVKDFDGEEFTATIWRKEKFNYTAKDAVFKNTPEENGLVWFSFDQLEKIL